DLLVHRVIKAILAERKYQLPSLPTPGEAHEKLSKRLKKDSLSRKREQRERPDRLSPEVQAWEAAGLHCSANERRADEASRDVEAWLKCKYMREHLGEEYGGVVSSVTSFGIFVTLDAMYVEGLVHITELGGEYFRFDESRQELRGERSGIRYVIGTRVRVQVSRVDLDGRRIDFRLVGDEDVPGGARNPREKATAAPSGGARSAPAGKRRPPLDIEDAGRGSLGGGGRKASSKSSTNTASAGKSRTQSTKAGGKTAKAKGRSARRT
ncbi:MAG TPA: S1 RNA-binding domain-containing protein, partial [Giesbergeria sp.]|nr:S1 RNA-binding domain-containing protein [Giesbergeria sp.]